MKHDSTLSTVAARTALYVINNNDSVIESADMIKSVSYDIVVYLSENFPSLYNEENILSVYAFVLSNVAKKAVKNNWISLEDFMAIFAEHKATMALEKNDYGAFGDLFEILVRLAFIRKNFRSWRALSVKAYNQTDLISKKIGKTEIGTNGKSFTFGTVFDYMAGDYTAIIYGMFSDDDKNTIYNYCANGQYELAINYISEYACIWADKYQFQADMDNLTRGKGITLKGENIQVVYNAGKYDAFQQAIENKTFTTLEDFLQA